MINLILSDSKRSLTYLKEIIKNRIQIEKIILYSKNYGITYEYIKKKKMENFLILFKTNDINSIILNKKIKIKKSTINIVSVYPGEIIKNPFLLKIKLLHCHPGDLPEFKGSTTIYYSIILKKKVCVTILVVNNKIDDGKIIYKKNFSYPVNFSEIEKNYDNKIRALTLVDYLKNKKNTKYKQTKNDYLPYYIAHPIIRKVVLDKTYLK
jgi:methionyl-tRNA formyltransferase